MFFLRIKKNNKIIFEGFHTDYFNTTLLEFIQSCDLSYSKNKTTDFYHAIEENELSKIFKLIWNVNLIAKTEKVSFPLPHIGKYEFLPFDILPQLNKTFFKNLQTTLQKASTKKNKFTFNIVEDANISNLKKPRKSKRSLKV